MIKIQNDIQQDHTNPLGCVILDPNVKDALLKLDIDFSHHDNPDYVFAMANEIRDNNLPIKPNTIAFERIDGCQIRNKSILSNPNLLKLVKMYKYADLETNNFACVDGRVFTSLLTDDIQPVKTPITQQMADKVALGTSFLHYKRHDGCEAMAIKGLHHPNPRTMDVFFAGTVDNYKKHGSSSGNLIVQHRQSSLRAIEAIQGITTDIHWGKTLNAVEYLNAMRNAKITVSPWGWGESCYRDYEAIMLQTEVIKPRSFGILSNPDIYSDAVYYCRPDWSDLESVIELCMAYWDLRKDIRRENAEKLINNRQPTAIADILAQLVKDNHA